MNKRQWFASTNPQPMLRHLADRASDRKLRLFAVACCRRHWPAFVADELSRQTVEVAERFADGTATVRECRVARAVAEVPWTPTADHQHRRLRELARATAKSTASGAALDTCSDATHFAGLVAKAAVQPTDWSTGYAADQLARAVEITAQLASLRCIFSYPLKPPAVEPSWLTSDVLALAQGMYESRDFGAAPILADALQDAGCTNNDTLNHLRQNGEHARGCWVLDLVLGKE